VNCIVCVSEGLIIFTGGYGPDPAGDFLPEEPEDDDMGIHFVNIKKYYTLWKNRVSQQCGNIQILALSKSEES